MSTSLPYLGLLRISGEGSKKLLQGQFTCNLDEISPKESRLAAHCNPQGRIISLFRVFMLNKDYYLQLPIEMLSDAKTALEKYAMFFKVSLNDATLDLASNIYTIDDLNSFHPLPDETDSMLTHDNLVIIKLPGPHNFYEIIGDPTHVRTILPLSKITNRNDWLRLQIEAGIPTVYPETASKLLPHEINLQLINALSFNKGCYTGQEIIARMHYRGQIKKRMYRAKVESKETPAMGADIFDPTPCGTVVTFCREQNDLYQLLVIANQADVENKQLFLDPAKTQPIEFLPLPY